MKVTQVTWWLIFDLLLFSNLSAGPPELRPAINDTPYTFKITCNLKVLSEETSSYGEIWDGDVSFLKDTKELIMIGLHPGRNSVAIRNKVYKRGVSTWGFQWVDVSYPQSDGRGGRHYTFEFGQSQLRLMCEQTILASFPYNELTQNGDQFLSSINTVKFDLGIRDEVKIKFAKVCALEPG